MGKIDLSINKVGLAHNIQKAKENNVIIPTIAQMQNPDLIPEKIKAKLSHTGLWDVDPVNLFRISWHNEAKESGGLFQAVPNYVEIPSKLSGVPCRIVAMSGKWFPTGCHKVGASFGCLAPRLVTGQFDATYHHAVWPSTGNYCRGGAFNSKLLACESIQIGSKNSFWAIFDGNITVIIVAVVLMGVFGPPDGFWGTILKPVLMWFPAATTGSIYSFGYTLFVGIIFNFVMGVTASRLMLKSISRFKFLRKPWLFGGKRA